MATKPKSKAAAPKAKTRNITAKLGRGGLTHEERRALMEKGIRTMFTAGGMLALSRDKVAAAAKCSASMVNNHFGTVQAMRDWAVSDAVERKDIKGLRKMHAQGYELPKMPRAMHAECVK